MSLRGPYFLRGAEGSGGLRSRRDQTEDLVLLSIGNRNAVKYSIENLSVVVQYFVPSYLNLSCPLAWDPITKQVQSDDEQFLSFEQVLLVRDHAVCHLLRNLSILGKLRIRNVL